jgi:hypothetical protein
MIELELVATGALLRVAREGENGAWRQVASPEDVLPLGQALLAMPLARPAEVGEHAGAAAPRDPGEPIPEQQQPQVSRDAAAPTIAVSATEAPGKSSPRLVLGGGVDTRYVGGSDVAWMGPTLSAAVRMGRWMPAISFRQQSTISPERNSIDELSVAVVVQSRFEISAAFELRAGLLLRGASVQRDLGHKHGEQSRIEGRIGAVVAGAIPLFRWANVVLSVDGEVVGVSRESAEPVSTDQELTTFPTYTLGGSACFEVPL